MGGFKNLCQPTHLSFSVIVKTLILMPGAAAAFATVYLFTAELFPTVARNQAVGVCALTAKLGGVTTMLLDMLGVGFIVTLQ